MVAPILQCRESIIQGNGVNRLHDMWTIYYLVTDFSKVSPFCRPQPRLSLKHLTAVGLLITPLEPWLGPPYNTAGAVISAFKEASQRLD